MNRSPIELNIPIKTLCLEFQKNEDDFLGLTNRLESGFFIG